MHHILSKARFLTLLLPLYFIFVSIQVGCGGSVRDDGSLEPVGGHDSGTVVAPVPPGCDDSYGCDYGGYGYGSSGYYGP